MCAVTQHTTRPGEGCTDDPDRRSTDRHVEVSGWTSGRFQAGKLVADRHGRPVTALRFADGVCYLAADGSVLAIDRDDPPPATM